MSRLVEIPFAGISLLDCDEQIKVEEALVCTDAFTDDNGLSPRNGYRKVTTSAIGSGACQGIWRFRPTPTTARTIVVRGGHIYTVTDPTNEQSSDGAATDLGAGFGATENISGAQLGKYFYLIGDLSTTTMYRIKPDFSAETYTTFPTPAVPAAPSDGTLAFVKFSTVAASFAGTGAMAATGQLSNDWYNLAGAVGDTATYTLYGSDQDWTSVRWLMLAASPETQSGGAGTFKVELGTNGGTFESLAVIADTPGDGSPFVIYFDLNGLTAATRAAIRKIRFTNMGPTTDPFSIGGWMPIPQPPSVGQTDYYTTYFLASTLQESQLSPAVTVVYSTPTVFPTFHAAQWYFNSFNDLGTRSVNPDTLSSADLWNKGVGKLFPLSQEFAAVKTFTVLAPPGTYDTARLWRQTTTGIRLVKAVAITPAGASVTIRDDQGDTTEAHQLYVASGGPPAPTAMCASQGRLIMGGLSFLEPSAVTYPNREAISSFLPFSATTDPFPQFPKAGIQPADGSFFDIAPSAAEGILVCGNGDKTAYVGTNEAMYAQSDLRPGGEPYKIVEQGVIGRRAWCWAEDSFFWAAHTGIYAAFNRSRWVELTEPIRRLYQGTFSPDSTVVLGYQDRKLFVVKGTSMLRYDFVKKRWSGPHTLAHTMQHCAFWRDPTGAVSTYQQLWFLASDGNLYRWQPGHSASDTNRASTDGGTTIPNWAYSSGYAWGEDKTKVEKVFLDTNGNVNATLYKDSSTGTATKVFVSGEHEYAFDPTKTAYKWRIYLSGGPAVSVRRAAVRLDVTSGEGH